MWDALLEKHSSEVMVLILATMVFGTLLVLVPQLLRARHRYLEMQHAEHLKALDKGQQLPDRDDRSWAAGRTAFLVPMVTVIAAATVTCFMAANKSEWLFSVTLSVWTVTGVVSLAAITGGVTLMDRLAKLQSGENLDENEEPAMEKRPMS